jgi:D-alanyl-D-alanine-carboxypeptidase/D-alanyl-D-alanine-endopeptidase
MTAALAKQVMMPTDAEILGILRERIDAMHRSIGIAAGVIDREGRRVIAHGHLIQGSDRPLDGETIFQVGSVTKVLTSLVLADMVQHNEVSLDDPVEKYLPSGVKVPQRGGRQITLVDLATHTSGLPRLPSNMAYRTINNPYADYSVPKLYEFLSSYKLTRDIGSKYEYSNLGGGLLGLALARRADMDYGELVRRRICDPLGMNSTRSQMTPEVLWRRAVGHNRAMQPTTSWDFGPATAGAGELWSDVNDLLTLLAAGLGYIEGPLAPAMAAMLDVRRPAGSRNLEVALAWHVSTKHGREIIWHNGGMGGYRSFIGYDRRDGVGVAVLSNAFTWEGVDDIGMHLLDSNYPLIKNPRAATVKFFVKLFARRLFS